MKTSVRMRTRFGTWAVAGVAVSCMLAGAMLTPAVQARSLGKSLGATPASGGTYTIWNGSQISCLNPFGLGGLLNGEVLDTLLNYDVKGHLIGNLATHWKVTNGGKRITIDLRQGVKFSNGDPFNAAAVKWTIDTYIDPATKSQFAGIVGSVAKTKAVSPYVFELDLKEPSRAALTTGLVALSMMDPKSPPTCSHVIGTGPYKYQSIASDFSTATAVVNKYHNWAMSWENNKSGVPYIPTIHVKTITSASTAVSDALSGGLDTLFNVDPTQVGRFAGSDFVVHKTYPSAIWYWYFNTTHAPFNTVAARKAWAEVIDRSAIIKAAFQGQAKPAYSVVPPAMADYDPKAAKLTPHYNLADATKLIQENHLTGPYHLVVLGDPTSQTIAQIIQASAAQAGMKIVIDTKAFPDWLSALSGGNFDASMINFGVGNDPDALYTLFSYSQCCGKGYDWNGYNNPAFEKAILKARTITSLKKAKPYYDKAQEIYAKNVPSMGLIIPSVTQVIRKNIKGWHLNHTQISPSYIDLFIKTK